MRIYVTSHFLCSFHHQTNSCTVISHHTSLFSSLQISWCTSLLVYFIPSFINPTYLSLGGVTFGMKPWKENLTKKNYQSASLLEKAPLYSLTCSTKIWCISLSLYLYYWPNIIASQTNTQPLHTNPLGRDHDHEISNF